MKTALNVIGKTAILYIFTIAGSFGAAYLGKFVILFTNMKNPVIIWLLSIMVFVTPFVHVVGFFEPTRDTKISIPVTAPILACTFPLLRDKLLFIINGAPINISLICGHLSPERWHITEFGITLMALLLAGFHEVYMVK